MATGNPAVIKAQQMMAEELGGRQVCHEGKCVQLRADGMWGSFTQTAYGMLSSSTRTRIEKELLAQFGTTPKILYDDYLKRKKAQLGKLPSSSGWLTLEQVRSALQREASAQGLHPTVIDIVASPRFIGLEAVSKGGLYDLFSLNPNTATAGPFQFWYKTWNGFARKRPDLRLSETSNSELRRQAAERRAVPGGPFDFSAHIRAFVALVKDNVASLGAMPITHETLYAMHQQGNTRRLKTARWSNVKQQSRASLQVLAAAHQQVRDAGFA